MLSTAAAIPGFEIVHNLSDIWLSLHAGTDPIALPESAGSGAELNAWLETLRPPEVVEAHDAQEATARQRLSLLGLDYDFARRAAHDAFEQEAEYARTIGNRELSRSLLSIGERRRKVTPFANPFLRAVAATDGAFQVVGLRSGEIFCPCPVSGALLRSRHSIPVAPRLSNQVLIFYYFEGAEPFYLACEGWNARKRFLYFPLRELIIVLLPRHISWGKYEDAVSLLKVLSLSAPRLVKRYLASTTEATVLFGGINNLGHFLWNDLSGLLEASGEGTLSSVRKILVYKSALLDPVPFVLEDGMHLRSVRASSPDELFRIALENRLFCVRPTAFRVSEDMVRRVEVLVADRLSPEQSQSIARARRKDVVLWFNLRVHNKVWVNQVEGVQALCKAITERATLALFLDGLPNCSGLVNEIRARLPEGVEVFDGTNLPLIDTLGWAFAVDAYVATIGSALTLVTWIAGKNGVAHSEHGHLRQMAFWGEVRKRAPLPLTPAPDQIKARGEAMYSNYEIDPRVIAELAARVLFGGPRSADTRKAWSQIQTTG